MIQYYHLQWLSILSRMKVKQKLKSDMNWKQNHRYQNFAYVYLFPEFNHIDTLEVNQISTPVYPMNVQFFDVVSMFDDSYFRYPKR